MQSEKATILLVEDDVSMGYLLKDSMEMAGHQVDLQTDGAQGWTTFLQKPFDLCVLDVMMPEKDGFTLAKEIRTVNTKVPIIFLTAKSMKEDRIKGFHMGADDYITKPFSIEEFLLRVAAVLKRTQGQVEEPSIYQFGNCRFDAKNQLLFIKSEKYQLTYREAKLLHLFCQHINELLSRDLIEEAVWESEGVRVGRSLDVFVSRLRKLFREEPSIQFTNVHGVGYKLEVATIG